MAFHRDHAKTLVMGYFGWFVVNGYAAWDFLDNGEIRLSFDTGETFLLTEAAIIRVA